MTLTAEHSAALSADQLAAEVSQLASIPAIAFRVNDLLNNDSSSAWDIGALIEQDPALSAALLKIANSVLYNNGIPVTAIDRAVTMVGAREVRDLAFAVCAGSAVASIPNTLIPMDQFWRHSLFCAAATRIVGEFAGLRGKDSLFMAGLLHDIGRLVMFGQRPELAREVIACAPGNAPGDITTLSERDVFGFDHAEAGAALIGLWQLPEYLQFAVRYHHEPQRASQHGELALCVYAANALACYVAADDQAEAAAVLDAQVLQPLGLGLDDVEVILARTEASVEELLTVFVR